MVTCATCGLKHNKEVAICDCGQKLDAYYGSPKVEKKSGLFDWFDSEPYPFLVISRYVSIGLAVIMFFRVLYTAFLILVTGSVTPFLFALLVFLFFLTLPELIQLLLDVRTDQRYIQKELHKLKHRE